MLLSRFFPVREFSSIIMKLFTLFFVQVFIRGCFKNKITSLQPLMIFFVFFFLIRNFVFHHFFAARENQFSHFHFDLFFPPSFTEQARWSLHCGTRELFSFKRSNDILICCQSAVNGFISVERQLSVRWRWGQGGEEAQKLSWWSFTWKLSFLSSHFESQRTILVQRYDLVSCTNVRNCIVMSSQDELAVHEFTR